MIPRASEFGLAALHGSAPNVGIAGYTLGGGLSFYVRKHGLACNRVTAMDLVVAGGEQIRVDATNEPDLFWAVRGGGGSFGVVTALEFDLLGCPRSLRALCCSLLNRRARFCAAGSTGLLECQRR